MRGFPFKRHDERAGREAERGKREAGCAEEESGEKGDWGKGRGGRGRDSQGLTCLQLAAAPSQVNEKSLHKAATERLLAIEAPLGFG